jgi:hypothetical protein
MNLKILKEKMWVLKEEIREWVDDGLIEQHMAVDMYMIMCSELIRREGVEV